MRKRWWRLVRAEGLEPPQLSSLEPKSSASTSSATPADSIIVRPRCRGRRAYNMGPPVRSKKMAVSKPRPDVAAAAGHIQRKMVRIGPWQIAHFPVEPTRSWWPDWALLALARRCPARLGGLPRRRPAPLALQAKADALGLRPGEPDTPIWSLAQDARRCRCSASSAAMRLQITLGNVCRCPLCSNWHGIDGVAARRAAGGAATARRRAAGQTLLIPLRHAGTFAVRPAGCWAMARRGHRAARALIVAGERGRRRRPRRGVSDRGLAAAAGRNRDRARHRSQRHNCRSTPSTGEPRWTSQPDSMNG